MYHISNDKRSMQSVQMIIDALLQLLNHKQLQKISIKDLCESAGVGRVTFYRHFDSIDDVLRRHCDDRFDQLRQYLLNYYKDSQSEPFLKPLLMYWYHDSQILEILIRYNKQDMIREAFMQMIQTMKKKSVQTGISDDNMSSYQLVIQSSVAIAVLGKWIENGKDVPPDALSQSILTAIREPVNINFEN